MADVTRPSIAQISMAETLEALIGIQEQVIRCRRLADEIRDPETAERLRKLADRLEQRARDVDRLP
jgi:hypothetical protein